MTAVKSLEVWADSFKEGEWFLENLASKFKKERVEKDYRFNFQPVFSFYDKDAPLFTATVYGDYKAWDPIPSKIRQILDYGKPDIILYDRNKDNPFFAVEETAAVPTGNQSLQRLERVCFAAEQAVPFAYLISEYGLHKDGGVRRSSIWPAYLALKLSSQYRVPSVTLFYSDAEHPEDYSVGNGVEDLAVVSYLYVREWLGEHVKKEKERVFLRIYKEMGSFILSQADEISPQLPGHLLLLSDDFLQFIAERVAST